ncbi:hypothetical protein CU098_008296 [Rhizopus stolonifer]|uniref:Uncharacterized protein n=1 Tax=Rhizopus stolonifer TaxID=4846 RepID=A0A367KIY1_RHIST|nr:hypothetical protein CU098_008296 [Rhizopus stolonifer]
MSSEPCQKSILQKDHAQEQKPHKIKWDENKLKQNEKQQREQVFMKVDEPKTPFVRYDTNLDKVLNPEELPGDLLGATEEPEEFSLDDSVTQKPVNVGFAEPEEWKKIDQQEKEEKGNSTRQIF